MTIDQTLKEIEQKITLAAQATDEAVNAALAQFSVSFEGLTHSLEKSNSELNSLDKNVDQLYDRLNTDVDAKLPEGVASLDDIKQTVKSEEGKLNF